MARYESLVKIRKIANCPVCSTYSYTLPINLTREIETFLLPFGKMTYNLNNCQIVRIDNENIDIYQARLGMNTFRVKFKKDHEKQKELFDIHLAAFLEAEMNQSIDM